MGLGRALAGIGRPRPAAEAFGRAHRAGAGAAALAHQALARQAAGDLGGALESWDGYLAERPGSDRGRAWRQRVLEIRGEIRRLRRALRSAPQDRELRWRLARLLEEAGDPEGALDVLSRDGAGEPGPGPDPRYLRGRLLAERGDLTGARRALREHLAATPHHLAGFYALAAVEALAGDGAAEAGAWEGALALRPGDAFAARAQFAAQARTGALEGVVHRLARQQGPGLRRGARVRLALAQEAAGRPHEALPHLLQAVEDEPNDSAVLDPLRELLHGDRPLLVEAVSWLSGRARRRPAALRARGVLRVLMGDPSGGAEDLGAFRERFPDDVRGQVAEAFAWRALGELGRAEDLLEGAAGRAPDYPFGRLDAAALALRLGDAGRAREHAGAALELLPLEPLPHILMGAALLDGGDVPGALRSLGRSLALDPVDASGRILPLAMRALLAGGESESVRLFLTGGAPLAPQLLYRLAWRHLRDAHLGAPGTPIAAAHWAAWRDRFDGKLHDAVDAHAAIGWLAARLEDGHTRLLSRHDALARLLRPGEVLAPGPAAAGQGGRSLYWELLEEGTVYLRLTSLRDPDAARSVEEVLEALPDVDEVVLDLRGNPGGYEDQADKIADLLLPAGEEVSRRVTRAGAETRETAGEGENPSQVRVLVDAGTASAAEHLADQLLAGGAGALVGGPTAGKPVAQIPFILPDGWTLLVTAARIEPAVPVD